PSSSRWRQHSKHFFVLSSAGKPIYSRYGDEAKLASIMGVIQAIWSFVAAENDTIRCLNAGSHRFVFLAKGPLYLVSVSTTKESDHQLRQQLEYLYLQLLFVLTSTQLTNIFERRRNYDLRNLISGTEMFLDHLSSSFQRSSGLFLGSVQCLRMVSRLRQKVGSILASNLPETVVFAILIAKEKLVTLVRPKRHSLHPTDLRLLINMVSSSSGFRSVETWTPVCLPQFNNRSFLHAYVSFLGPELYLVMASTSKDAFFELSEYKQRLVQELETTGTVEAIEEAITADPYSGVELEIPSVRHFIYKSSTLVQHTEPALAPPYTRKEDLQRLFRAYQFGLERYNVVDDPARVVFFTNTAESVLCCFTPTHQILLAFSPFITKAAALDALHGLQKWIKREESTLFLSTAPVF
ncbi:vacuolar fusion protein MON1, partial [Phlyctochytrium arcticum]